MPRQWQETGVDDFSGGVTDYVDNAEPNQSAEITNFVISRDRGIQVREGSDIWNLNPLPNNLNALQLFQLEEYIFAYTDDGDIYWTFDDGLSDWTEILTAADNGADWGGDFFFESDTVIYIVPDPTIQTVEPWDKIKCECVETVIAGAGTNSINLFDITEPETGLHYFRFEFIRYTANDATFPWTTTLTEILDAGLNGQGAWEVWLDRTQLVSGHADVIIDKITDGETTLDFNDNDQTDFGYRPIYLNRVKPFVDASFNGALSVSKFAGHLYLALYPDDRSWEANPSDVFSDQPDTYQINNKRCPLRKIYLLYEAETETTTPRCTSAQLPNCDVAAYPEDGNNAGDESNQYIYEVYARQSYYALVEGEPRLFIVDGPSRLFEYLTEFEPSVSNPVKVAGRILPRIQYNVEIYPLEEIELQFFRTQKNETVPTLVNGIDGTLGLIYPNWEDSWGAIDPDLQARWDTGDGNNKGLFYVINQDVGTTDSERRIDTNSDADIVGNEESYDATTDFGYINIPQGPYYFVVSNQIGYYADIFKLKNRVYQSIYGVPHANIAISFLDFDDGITGINTFRDKAVVFTRESVWRMEGFRGLDGRGSISQRLVSDEFGAISNQSIIRTNYGLFFFSRTGICYTDGWKCFRVSEQLFDTYFEIIEDVDYIRGFYHESEQKIYWAVRRPDSKTYWIILHLRFGISKNIPLSFATGVDWLDIPDDMVTPDTRVDRFDPQVATVNETTQKILRHSKTYILQHDSSYTTDRFPDQDQEVPILFNFISQAHNMGTKKHRKWVANVMMVMKELDKTGISCQPTGYNDLAETAQLCGPCFAYPKMEWGDPEQEWRNPDATQDAHKFTSFRRMFPEGSIRATYKQFGIKSLYIHSADNYEFGGGRYNSFVSGDVYRTYINIPVSLSTIADTMEQTTGQVDGSGQFAIKLPGITGQDWNVIHRVVDNTDNFDVYIDPDRDADSGQTLQNIDWALGYIRTEERIGLDNYTLRYTVIGERTHGAYENSDGASEGDGTEG